VTALLIRSEIIKKWALYSGATILIFLLQGLLLRHIVILGVFPFLYPVLTAITSSLEGTFPGTVYGLVLGVVCDLTIAAPIPCFYTLLFPIIALLAALISRRLLSSGFLCSLACSGMAFLLNGLFHALLLWLGGQSAWGTAAWLTLREGVLSLLFSPIVFFLFSAVHQKCLRDE